MYIYHQKGWPHFHWDEKLLLELLGKVRHKQGRLLGKMEGIGFDLQSEAILGTLTLDVLKSSEIEGEVLDKDQVRSSIARGLGLDIAGLVPSDRHIDGVVEMMLDATQNYNEKLTGERLFAWHASLFPAGRSGMSKIVTGNWRNHSKYDPMRVVSGPLGKERVHFQAPDTEIVDFEMKRFLNWINSKTTIDLVLKAAIAHLWFVTIHPFDDGNGRVARAITDLLLSRSDQSDRRFYSMSAQIRIERKSYYQILESTQKGSLDVTKWLQWFLNCLDRSLDASESKTNRVLRKYRFWEKFKNDTFNERQRKMINKLFEGFEGKLTSSKWAKITKCSQDSAGRDINNLINKNILIKSSEGGRSTSYLLNW